MMILKKNLWLIHVYNNAMWTENDFMQMKLLRQQDKQPNVTRL